MRVRNLVWALVLCAGLGTQGAEAQGPPGGQAPPPEVTLAPVEVKTVPISYEYVGMTAASKTVEVRARIQGFIETRDFQEGAYVEEGARLFTVDPRSFQADQQIAVAQVEQAECRLRLAQQEVKRMQSVKQPGAIAQTDLDQRITEQSTAAAALRLAKAQLAKADLELSYTTVNAPLTGFVGKAQKEIGSLVDPSQNSLMTVMQQVDPLYVSFPVTESDFLTWKREEKGGVLVLPQGQQMPDVHITLLDGTPFDSAGVLDFENVDLSKTTGTVELRATFKNADKLLKPGQFVNVQLSGWQRPNTMTVPKRAVCQSPAGAYVYVVGADSTAERRSIKEGPWSGEDWVVLDGLKEGEQVIVEGLTKVRPGAQVSLGGPGGAPEAAGTPGAAGAPEATAAPSEPAQ